MVPVLVRQRAKSESQRIADAKLVRPNSKVTPGTKKTRLRTLLGGGKFQGQGEAKAPLIGRSFPFRDKRGPALAANPPHLATKVARPLLETP